MAVIERDLMCLRCGSAGGQIHHRKPRGAGGTSDPAINGMANLVWVCQSCHSYIESHRNYAYADGWLVHRECDFETVHLVDLSGQTFFLTDGGDVINVFCPPDLQPPF